MTVARRILQNRSSAEGLREGATIRRVMTSDAGTSSVSARCALWIYDCLVVAIVWLVLAPFTIAQIVRRTATLEDLRQRLGRITLPSPRGVRIVVHAVSAGEMTAAAAFIQKLAAARPDWTVVLTSGTRDGAALAGALRTRLSSIEAVINLPWDRRRALERWLRSLGCSAVVVVEPEIWPNLYDACGRQEVRLLLVNGHIYPHDVSRYRLARRFFRHVLRMPDWIGVQSEVERGRFAEIGASVDRMTVTGSLKFDVAATDWSSALADRIKAVEAPGLTLIGGSTYELEEHALLEALGRLRPRVKQLRLILAPRHVARASEVAATATSFGLRAVLGSALTTAAEPWQVLVVDRLGELAALYAVADVAFVGGTMVPRGGHNLLEPAARGRPIVVGPYTEHITEFVEGLAAAGGAVRMRDAESSTLVNAVESLLVDDGLRRESGRRAREYCRGRMGAAGQSVGALIACVERAGAVSISARDPQHAPPETWRLDANEAASSGGAARHRQGW